MDTTTSDDQQTTDELDVSLYTSVSNPRRVRI